MVYNHSNANYDVGNEIIYKTEVSKSNLCDYNNTCILVRGDINNVGHNLATKITFKTCAPFTKCITKMNGRTIDDADDLDFGYSDVYKVQIILIRQAVSGFIQKMKQII